MREIKLENLTICQQCGCAFSPQYCISTDAKDNNGQVLRTATCPACKTIYDLGKK